ncbi:hypothetical protein BDN70DRAFT_684630 [Pholiota conissans]|uniref:F-box domain-containing protein n=1 Tax=Pholiota conissans TaxID=109636 RepID=A0A9P5Z3R9_9AGAR|nr:hypothetical protein BDN70DRAFT_684630 [Pholiota conissans]
MSIPVPLEILAQIIDTVAEEDPQFVAIKTCSLVCFEFVHLCRKHIFASIFLCNAPQLQRLLSTTPEIANHIRSLEYCILVEDLANASLFETFTKITRLKSLTLEFNYTDENHHFLPWNDNPLRPAILHLMHLPTLNHLKLENINSFLLSDLMLCTNLDWLDLAELNKFENDNDLVLKPSTSPPLQLSELTVRGWYSSPIHEVMRSSKPKPICRF